MTDVTAKRVHWYRRSPPPGLPRFPKVVWWAGHAQLFIGVAAAVVGLVLLFGGDGPWQWGLLLVSTALPFATSGMMLRAQGLRQATLTSRSWAVRIAELAAVVLGVAVLSIVFVIVDVWVLFFAFGWILNYAMH
ncbi:hypothetical protein ACRAWC_01515 [Leifsonia sp. L25]|uniref:hypothetical protein n=1 Tax=Actinomycetes TaxID=1760 RepID=UPI003D682129